jgi:glycosyltransferase involved in cell wall biosynthesis
MIKVLHYVTIMNRAGQETFIMNIFRNISRDKVMFDFLCTLEEPGDFDEEIRNLGGAIRYIQLNKVQGKIKQLHNTYLLYDYLKKNCKEYSAFHIHTQHAMDAFLSSCAAKLAGIKTVIVHSHSTSTAYHVSAHKIFKVFLRLLPIVRFACSKAAGYWMYGNDKCQVINNALDIDKFSYTMKKRIQIRNKMNWNDKLIIGHVGRFNEVKNHTFLIDVFKEIKNMIPNAHLVLIGQGELEATIKGKVHNLQLAEDVTFLGLRIDVSTLYQGMDLFLFPSLFEGLGIVLIEAQTSGLPCFISDTIPPEIDITPGVKRIKLNESSLEWARIIQTYIQAGHERKKSDDLIKKAGYDIQDVAVKLETFYYDRSRLEKGEL